MEIDSTTSTLSGKFGRLYRQSNTTSYYSTGITHTLEVLYID